MSSRAETWHSCLLSVAECPKSASRSLQDCGITCSAFELVVHGHSPVLVRPYQQEVQSSSATQHVHGTVDLCLISCETPNVVFSADEASKMYQ